MGYYNEYVNHMLRFYSRFPEAHKTHKVHNFKTKTDMENWVTVKRVLDKLPDKDKKVIMEVYRRRDTIPDNVYEISKEYGIKQDFIWSMLNKITKQIAKDRKLI